MKEPKSAFPTEGTSVTKNAVNASAQPGKGKLVAKKNTAAGDPTREAAPIRANIKQTAGAAYGIRTTMPAWNDPHIGPVQGNGRLFSSAINRTGVEFKAGTVDHDQ